MLTQEDNERLIQPIPEHLIRNRQQLRTLHLSHSQAPAQLGLFFQFIEAATQNPLIEELRLGNINSLPVDGLV